MAQQARVTREKDEDKVRDAREEQQERAARDVQDILGILPVEAKAQILRLLPNGQRLSCGRPPADVLKEDPEGWIAEHYGPGKYSVMFWGPEKKYLGHSTLEIAPEHDRVREYMKRRAKEERGTSAEDEDAAQSGHAAVGAGVASLLDASARAMGTLVQARGDGGENAQLMVQVMQQQAAASDRMMQMFMAMMQNQTAQSAQTTQMMTSLITAVLAGKSDPMDLATRMAELVKGGGGAGAGTKEMIEMMKSMVELRDMVTGEDKDGDEDGGNGFGGVVKAFAPAITRLVDAGMQARNNPPARETVERAQPGGPIASSRQIVAAVESERGQEQPEPGEDMLGLDVEAQMKKAVVEWLAMAKAGEDPARSGARVWGQIESAPAVVMEKAAEFLAATSDPDDTESPFTLEDKVGEWVPDTKPYAAWFTEFFDEMRVLAGIITEDEEEEEERPAKKPRVPREPRAPLSVVKDAE